jgi:integrase
MSRRRTLLPATVEEGALDVRDGEIAGLQWQNVDFDAASGSCASTRRSRCDARKRSARSAPPRRRAACATRQSTRVRQGAAGVAGAPWRPRSADVLRIQLRAAGCDDKYAGKPIDFHALRRSFATWLARRVERRAQVDHGAHRGRRHRGALHRARSRYALRRDLPHSPRPRPQGEDHRVPWHQSGW